MAYTKEVTGHKIIKAGVHVYFGGGVSYEMHQVSGGVTPTLDIYGSFSNEPHRDSATGIATDSSSTLVAVNVEAGGSFIIYGRGGASTGVSADCPMTFVNDGAIQVYNFSDPSLGFYGSASGFNLNNSGSVDVHSSGNAEGLSLSGDGAYVNNSGGIGASGRTAEGLSSDGANLTFINSGTFGAGGSAEATGMTIAGDDASIQNLGTIEVSAAEAKGMVVTGSGADFDNAGTFSVAASGSGPSYGVEIAGGSDITITNSGTITAADAIVVDTGVTSDVTLISSGHIDGAVVLGMGADTIENSGVISRAVHLGGGDDVFEESGHSHVRGGVYGGDGNDTLTGARAGDHLFGADGDDQLNGAGGADVLSGGAGSNVFVYQAVKDSTAAHSDLITDLSADDRIDLSGIDADTTTSGDQAFHLVSAFDGHAGELVLSYDSGTNTTFIEGDVNGDGVADLVIRATGDHSDFTGFTL